MRYAEIVVYFKIIYIYITYIYILYSLYSYIVDSIGQKTNYK